MRTQKTICESARVEQKSNCTFWAAKVARARALEQIVAGGNGAKSNLHYLKS